MVKNSQRPVLNAMFAALRAGSLLVAGSLVVIASNAVPIAAAEEGAAANVTADNGTAGDTDAYLAKLRAALPQSWLQREFQRQRSFPAFAHSRQLIAKGQYQDALRELEEYLAFDPDDLVIQFGYLLIASDLKRYHAVIAAADRILAAVPDFAPARFYRGLALAALGENKEALPDLAAAADSKALAPGDEQYARRSLAVAAVAAPADADALSVLEREEAKAGADSALLVAKGQLLARLGRNSEAITAYDDAVRLANNDQDKRVAWLFAAQLALKTGDPAGALARAQAAWQLAPGNPETATVLAEAASRLGRTDLVERAERETKAGTTDRGIRESLANALFRVGRFDQAATNFEELAETAASPGEEYRLRRAAGFAAQAAGDASRAFSDLQRAAAIDPTPEALTAAAEASLQAGHADVAAGNLVRLAEVSEGKNRDHALERLSVVEEQRGRFQEALAALDQIPAERRDASLEQRSAFLAAKIGDLDTAVKHAQRVADLQPTRANFRALGEAQLAAGHPEAAVEAFQRALDSEPGKDSSLREMLANTLAQAGQPSRAAAEFETLAASAELPVDKNRYLERLSYVFEMQGRTKKALDTLAQLPKPAQAQPEIIRREAVLAQKLGDRHAMLAHLRELAAAEPNENNLAALADAEIGEGQTNAAAQTLEALLTVHGLPAERKAGFLERLGNIEIARGNAKRSQALFLEAYHLSPAHPAEWLAQAAESAMQAKDWQEAVEWYRILADNDRIPRKTRAGYAIRLGMALANSARDQEAIAAFDEAIQLGGATPSLRENRGMVLMHLGRAAAAAPDLRAAYDAHPTTQLALALGYAYQAARQPGPAIVFFRRALTDAHTLSPAKRQQASAALGYAYSDTEQHEKATGCFEAALGILTTSNSWRNCGLGYETVALQ
jgi:tetratricopeptide (TPR) repeat protein